MNETLAYTDTPVDYAADASMIGRIDLEVGEGDDIADVGITDGTSTISLRLNRDEIVALISSLAGALAALS